MRKGGKMSLEQRQKISDAMKGRKPWNLGKKMSEETKKKISEAKKGQVPWNKGVKVVRD